VETVAQALIGLFGVGKLQEQLITVQVVEGAVDTAQHLAVAVVQVVVEQVVATTAMLQLQVQQILEAVVVLELKAQLHVQAVQALS
jgi:hypothetical protein